MQFLATKKTLFYRIYDHDRSTQKNILIYNYSMKVGIYGQFQHDEAARYVQHLLEILSASGVKVIIEKNFLELIKAHDDINLNYDHFSTFEELDNTYDLFFSIGGDGTFIQNTKFWL